MARTRITWTRELVEWLLTVFPETSNEQIMAAVPGLSLWALATKASDLGLRKSSRYRHQYLAVNRQLAINALTGIEIDASNLPYGNQDIS